MTGYLWRGRPDLAAVNAAIMAEREKRPRSERDRIDALTRCERFMWGRPVRDRTPVSEREAR